jgi:hypothetical protein
MEGVRGGRGGRRSAGGCVDTRPRVDQPRVGSVGPTKRVKSHDCGSTSVVRWWRAGMRAGGRAGRRAEGGGRGSALERVQRRGTVHRMQAGMPGRRLHRLKPRAYTTAGSPFATRAPTVQGHRRIHVRRDAHGLHGPGSAASREASVLGSCPSATARGRPAGALTRRVCVCVLSRSLAPCARSWLHSRTGGRGHPGSLPLPLCWAAPPVKGVCVSGMGVG